MTCPYCRGEIREGEAYQCPACEVPHHADCFAENEGCTVFGCVKGPEDEEKITIEVGDSASSTRLSQYHVTSHGRQLGPHSLEEIRGMISRGQVSLSEYGWTSGMNEWAPLYRILGGNQMSNYQNPSEPRPAPPIYQGVPAPAASTYQAPPPSYNSSEPRLAPPVYQGIPAPVASTYQAAPSPSIYQSVQHHPQASPYNSQQFFQNNQTCPPTYMTQAIFLTLCCCLPLGIVSIIYASQVEGKYNNGDFSGAQSASDMAKGFIIGGFISGLILAILYIVGAASSS